MPAQPVLLLLISPVSPFPLAFNLRPMESPTFSGIISALINLFIELDVADLIPIEFRDTIVQNAPLIGLRRLIEQLRIRLISSLKFKNRRLIELNF